MLILTVRMQPKIGMLCGYIKAWEIPHAFFVNPAGVHASAYYGCVDVAAAFGFGAPGADTARIRVSHKKAAGAK